MKKHPYLLFAAIHCFIFEIVNINNNSRISSFTSCREGGGLNATASSALLLLNRNSEVEEAGVLHYLCLLCAIHCFIFEIVNWEGGE